MSFRETGTRHQQHTQPAHQRTTAKARWTPYTACPRLKQHRGVTDTAEAKHKPHTPPNSRPRAVNECQGAMDTANAMQSAHTMVNERQGAIDTAHTMHSACTLVNKRQGDMDIARRCLSRLVAVQVATHRSSQAIRQARGSRGSSRLLIEDRLGGTRDHGKPHLYGWKQPLTGELVQSPERGRLTPSEISQLKQQG